MNFSISGTSGFYLNAQFCLLFSSLFYCISIFSFTKENKYISLYVLYYRIQQTIVHNIQSFEDKPAVMCDRPQITTQQTYNLCSSSVSYINNMLSQSPQIN